MNGRSNSLLTGLMSHRWFPAIFQWTVVVMLLFTAYAALFTASDPSRNFALVFVWIFWGTVAPISLLIFGRYWCAMCPFYLLGSKLNKLFGRNKALPRAFRRHAGWGALVLFIVIIWYEHAVNIFQSTILTLLLLVPVLIGAVVGALLYRNNEFWCRGLCPLGPLARNYATLSVIEVRAGDEACSSCTNKSCYRGEHEISGCPVGLYTRSLSSMKDCIACGECFKSCPTPGAISARVRGFFEEFGRMNLPKLDAAMFASVWPGVLFIHFFTLLPAGDRLVKGWMADFGVSSYLLAWTILYLGATLLSIAVVGTAAAASTVLGGEAFGRGFTRFAYAFIPLGAGIHTAFNMPRFLGEQGLNRATHNLMAIFGVALDGPMFVLDAGATRVLMMALLAGGLLASFAVLRYINRDAAARSSLSLAPYAAMLSGIAVGVGMFFQNYY